jgi:hypothetical protein
MSLGRLSTQVETRKIKVNIIENIYIYNSSIFHLYNNKKKRNLYENFRALHKSYTGSISYQIL